MIKCSIDPMEVHPAILGVHGQQPVNARDTSASSSTICDGQALGICDGWHRGKCHNAYRRLENGIRVPAL